MAILVPITLQEFPYYEQPVILQDNSFILRLRWNTREACYYFDLLEQNGTPIILGTKLVESFPMLGRQDLTDYGLTGSFGLFAVGTSQPEIVSYSDIPQYYRLFYIYDE